MATMRPTLLYKHISIDDNGVARVGNTRMKVIHLVTAHQIHGYSPAELHFQFPDISMSEVHAALAYYWDHKDDLDNEIEQLDQYIDQLRHDAGESLAAKRLRRLGYLA